MYGVATGKPYKVATGNLTVSVIIFCILAAVCIFVLIMRRKVGEIIVEYCFSSIYSLSNLIFTSLGQFDRTIFELAFLLGRFYQKVCIYSCI
jgi:hypothetical protein